MPFTCTIKVIPGSKKQKAVLDKTGRLKLYLKSQAQEGKANKELISYISAMVKIPQRDIVIFAGEHARTKIIKITTDITFEKLLTCFDIVIQSTLI